MMVTFGPCQRVRHLVGCRAHDGAGSLRGLLLLRLPRAGTGPARDGLAPPLPPPPVHPAPPHTDNYLGAPRRQTRMAVRGIRGATTTEEDSETAIVDATTELLAQLARENALSPSDIAAVWFTTTPDLTAEFPAAAARRFGWGDVPLLCGHEMAVPSSNPRSLPRCIRVLLLVNTDRPSSAMRFVYLRGAEKLRVTA